MLCGSFSFAWMSSLAHLLGPSCDWRIIALARSSLAFLFAVGLARAAGARLVLFHPRVLWMRSIAGSVSLVCSFYAITRLPPHVVLTLTNTFPIWVAVLSWPLLNERPPRAVWLAVVTGVLGVILIKRPFDNMQWDDETLATVLALGASVSTAVAMLGLHRLQGIDTLAIVVHFSGVAALFCVGSLFVGQPANFSAAASPRLLLLLLAIGATATVGQLFLTKAFAAGPPARVSVIGLTQVVFALFLDAWLEQPSFHPTTLLGIALVVAPTAWMMLLRG
jgi:drug/metabolite transporter (DMT)-like permease